MNIRHDHVTVFVARRVDEQWQLLQLRRHASDYLGGTWQTVRGTMEAGETAVQTALRELGEEAGLVPIEFYTLGIVETFYIAAEDAMWHSPVFVAIVAPDAPVRYDGEHDAHRWIDLADAQRQFMWPSERPVIDAITREIFGDGLSKPLLLIRL